DSDRVAGHRRHEAVGEIYLRAGLDAFDDRVFALYVERVPANMRNLDDTGAGQLVAASAEQAEPGQIRRFFAALEQPLHAEANAEQRPSFADAPQNALNPFGSECTRRTEMSDAGHDDRRRVADRTRGGRREQIGAKR